jgi:hypothetical protein
MNPELIVWLDHCEPSSENVWWSPDDVEQVQGPAVMRTVGFVIRECDGWILVTSQVTEDGWCAQPMVLVSSCIVSRKTLV